MRSVQRLEIKRPDFFTLHRGLAPCGIVRLALVRLVDRSRHVAKRRLHRDRGGARYSSQARAFSRGRRTSVARARWAGAGPISTPRSRRELSRACSISLYTGTNTTVALLDNHHGRNRALQLLEPLTRSVHDRRDPSEQLPEQRHTGFFPAPIRDRDDEFHHGSGGRDVEPLHDLQLQRRDCTQCGGITFTLNGTSGGPTVYGQLPTTVSGTEFAAFCVNLSTSLSTSAPDTFTTTGLPIPPGLSTINNPGRISFLDEQYIDYLYNQFQKPLSNTSTASPNPFTPEQGYSGPGSASRNLEARPTTACRARRYRPTRRALRSVPSGMQGNSFLPAW